MLTPGVSVSRSSNLRPRIGVVSIVVLVERARGGRARRRRRSATASVTVTVSATPDTFMLGVQPHRLADRDEHVLLDERREAGQLERHGVAAGRQLQRHEAPVAIGRRACA